MAVKTGLDRSSPAKGVDGLPAIADGFAMLDIDDERQLALELPAYDALYAWATTQVGATYS